MLRLSVPSRARPGSPGAQGRLAGGPPCFYLPRERNEVGNGGFAGTIDQQSVD
jgi:hypothetical protein